MSAEIASAPLWQSARPTRILRALPRQASRMGRLPFIASMIALLALGLVGALLLNTQIQAQSVQLSHERARIATLSHQEAALSAQVDVLRSPTHLQQAAKDLGMVPNPYPGFVDLRTGKVVGTAKAVTGKEVPGLTGSGATPNLQAGTTTNGRTTGR